MPYKINKKGVLLGFKLDRRIKLTPDDKIEIKKIYENGETSINGLARIYKVNKRTIQFILFPERLVKNKQDRKKRGGWKQYYKGGKEWAETAREHRHYKHNVLKKKQK